MKNGWLQNTWNLSIEYDLINYSYKIFLNILNQVVKIKIRPLDE